MTTDDRRRMKRLRDVFDLLATIVILVAGTLFIKTVLWPPPRAVSAQTRPSAPSLQVPSIPVSLQGAPLAGDPHARVAMIEFSDFECPFCGKFAREVLPQLEDAYIKTGRVQMAFLHFPLPIHARASRRRL